MIDRAWIAARIPHQGSMCLLDAVESWDEQQIVCRATSHALPDNPLRAAGSLGVANAIEVEQLQDGFWRVVTRFGFMETPNVPKALVIARKLGWQFDIMATSFFVSRRSLKPSAQSGMPQWQDHLFIAMSRSANDATDYFQIPTGRVVEVGTQVTI